MIRERITSLEARLQSACARAGKNRDDITLLAVSKTFGAELVREVISAGLRDFGENYVQELTAKKQQLNDLSPHWHFVGHLQTNKVKYIADFVYLIHSVDNLRLAQEIDKRAEQCGRVLDVLVEVHTTDESTKYGVKPEDTARLVREIALLPHVRIQGLMTMGPFSDDPNDSRPSFSLVAKLAKEIERERIEGVRMKTLSMGMTHDFEVAIEEGATVLRIGTAIFGERKTVTDG